jgi:hypothetical protein
MLETETDSSGRFSLDCRATAFRLVLHKGGYQVDESLVFGLTEPPQSERYETNLDVRVFLDADR